MSISTYQRLDELLPMRQLMEVDLDAKEDHLVSRAKTRERGSCFFKVVCCPCAYVGILVGCPPDAPKRIFVESVYDQCRTALQCWDRPEEYVYTTKTELEMLKTIRRIKYINSMNPFFEAIDQNKDLFRLMVSYLE